MGIGEISKFLAAPNRILNANEVAACRNEETKTLHDQLIAMLKSSNGECSINLVWVTSGNLTPTARRYAVEKQSWVVNTEITGNPTSLTVTLECLDLAEICQRYDDLRDSDDILAKCDHIFTLEDDSYHQTSANAEYPTLSMTVPVKQIIDVFARHSYKIFRLNPRGPLGNKVNAGIKRTLLDQTERKRFHLLNNGITAICSSWAISNNELRVQDFQIINGCQTTVTLWNVRAAIQNDTGVLVTVKLTECPEHFAEKIASTTNTQTAFRAEDFTSNESVQIRIQSEFSRMNPPWFYQVKRGEWQKMMGGPREKEAYRDPDGSFRQLNSRDVAQAVVAFAGFPGEAKDKIRNFLNKETVSSIAKESEFTYDSIYTPTVSAVQLLLPAVVQRKVRKQVVADKETADWLEYARFHIIWLIGDILREHYQLDSSLFPATRSSAITTDIDLWFSPVYSVAVAAIRSSIDPIRNTEQYRGHREFFRSAVNYRAMESNVRNALQLAATFGDPTENLPA